MADIYDTDFLAGLTQKQYEKANKVQWPWAADKIEFTRAEVRDLDEFGQADSVDRLMSEINNGRMHDIDKMIDDFTLLLIFAFALGFIANRYMSHQNILTGDVEEGVSAEAGIVIVGFAIFFSLGVGVGYFWGKLGFITSR